MDYALIENGEVVNLIWLYPGNEDDFPEAVPVGKVPVHIGDTYDGMHFYRDGERVLTYTEYALRESADMQAALGLLGVSIDG